MQGTPPFIHSKSCQVSKNWFFGPLQWQGPLISCRHYKFIVPGKYKSMVLCEYKSIVTRSCKYKLVSWI